MAAEDLIWIAGDASTYTLRTASTEDRNVVTVEGVGLPGLEHQGKRYPFLHGELDLARKFGPRQVLIEFWQVWDTRSAADTGRRALEAAFNPELGKGQLKWVDADATDWRLDAWVRSLPLDRRGIVVRKGVRTVIELWVPWPFWRKSAQESPSGSFSGTTPVDIAVSNDGHVPSVPNTITIGGQATNPLIEIVGTGKKLDIQNTIASGETVTATCFPPYHAALTKDGSSIIGDLTYDSVLASFELPKGSSTVRITGGDAGDNGTVTINFYEWYLGL